MEPKFKKEDKPLDINSYLYNELFINVTTSIIPNVFDYYQISNYGRLYHKKLGKFIKYGINGGGYYYTMLSTYDGPKPIQIYIKENIIRIFQTNIIFSSTTIPFGGEIPHQE